MNTDDEVKGYRVPEYLLKEGWNSNPIACDLCGMGGLFAVHVGSYPELINADRWVHALKYKTCSGRNRSVELDRLELILRKLEGIEASLKELERLVTRFQSQ